MECRFWDLIDYRITFDFLMGNFTNVFKRQMFLENLDCLDKENLKDNRLCSILIIVVATSKSMHMPIKIQKHIILQRVFQLTICERMGIYVRFYGNSKNTRNFRLL